VDGLIIGATVAMADDKRTGQSARPAARVALAIGGAASLAANILATPWVPDTALGLTDSLAVP
jgi:hypothetical protein